ncbi:MAG: glutamate--cysteine ligase [Gammaproteobacteria bacterium]|nr:MAG: glutamate--cysteine ligase [Gammaproteobacteria bacterium]
MSSCSASQNKIKQRLNYLKTANNKAFNYKIGLEKESLRVDKNGFLSNKAHPDALGQSFTNSFITTDFCESQLELITPPLHNIDKSLQFLTDLHSFVYKNITKEQEILWASSMPCIIADEEHIPIATYGKSNQGMMKHIYRQGLALRYGKLMQTITGVHINFSFSDIFWQELSRLENSNQNIQDFITSNYMSGIRNMQKMGWLIPYLFGSSPAICKSFLQGAPTKLKILDDSTYYHPYATSLRMGDIGYQNNIESKNGFKANYDNLAKYIQGLQQAINTRCQKYNDLSIIKNNKYQQLNSNILQIENEYYSTVRPKQICELNQSPNLALKENGILYVELRSSDVDLFSPIGVNRNQLYFVVLWIYYCTLKHSNNLSAQQKKEIDENEIKVAHFGRSPNLMLQKNGKKINLKDWGLSICKEMESLAKLLDSHQNSNSFRASLKMQINKFKDQKFTPSARVLKNLSSQSFHRFASHKSQQYVKYFKGKEINEEHENMIIKEVSKSIKSFDAEQKKTEPDFKIFIDDYYKKNIC